MLRGVIGNIASRRRVAHKQKRTPLGRNGHSNGLHLVGGHDDNENGDDDEVKTDDEPAQALRRDLERIENRIRFLQGLDPDDGDIIVER